MADDLVGDRARLADDPERAQVDTEREEAREQHHELALIKCSSDKAGQSGGRHFRGGGTTRIQTWSRDARGAIAHTPVNSSALNATLRARVR